MKKLLVSIILGTTILAPVVNQDVVSSAQDNYSTNEFYWKSDHQDVLIESTYLKNTPTNNYFLYTVFVGDFNIEEYATASILDPNDVSYTKTSWGNTAYWGTKPSAIKNKSIKEIFENKKIVTDEDISKTPARGYLYVDETSFLARMISLHFIGFSYYSENGANYIQIFGVQYAESINSYSGGAMWTNIGQGIKFDY